MKEKQYTATQNLEHKNNELCKHNIYLEKVQAEKKALLQEIKQLEEKRDNLKSYKPNLQDQQLLEQGSGIMKLQNKV
ncbi:hypothetical protein EAG_14996 [Camponotus floridanus]|uniref:Uncharacterized protein n=1 Tax=Camponotus floridanus TaxID=104421 RepID=E2ARP7_CAMFO|nr:hypothetical protein EAG_14996 [Camponotus floridanus]